MRFDLTDDQSVLRDATRRFLEAECPVTRVREWHQLESGFERNWWRQACDLGWTSMLASSGAGGGSISGQAVCDAAVLAEERGRVLAPGPFVAVNVVAAGLAAGDSGHGGEAAELVSGSAVGSWAFAEAASTWDPRGLTSSAEVRADSVVLSGSKHYVDAAAQADFFLVTAKTGSGLTNVVVPADADGVRIVAGKTIDVGRRLGRVDFDNVKVPVSAIVGDIGGADAAVERMAQIAVVLQCADTVGTVDRVFEFTLQYLGDRYAFGRPIGSFQSLKHRAADMLLWLESAKAATDAAATSVDEGAPEAARLVSAAKSYVGAKSVAIIQDCMQMLGGISMTWEHDVHLYLRRATLDRSLYGTPEQHKEHLCVLLGV